MADFHMKEVKTEELSVHEQVVELLNSASLEPDDQLKVDKIIQIQELIIHREPALLDNFLDEVVAFQNDRSVDVRKCIVAFIEEACKKDHDILVKIMPSLQMLLCDESIAVQKRVCQSLTQLYKTALSWLSGAQEITQEMEESWKTLCHMKSRVAEMIDHDNDGVRTLAVKFYEMLIVSQTYPEHDSIQKEGEFSLDSVPLNLVVARPRKLEEEARKMLDELLKFHGSAHISSANLMACMGSLTHIAKSRPQFLERIVMAMERLHANLPPTLSKSQVSSVRKHLKLQLLAIVKHPASFGLSDTIKALLSDLGAAPHELSKILPSQEEIARHSRRVEHSMAADVKTQPPSKKRRLNDLDEPVDQVKPSLTEQFVLRNMNPKVAADIVIATMPHVPVSMSPHFRSQYVPLEAGPPNIQALQVSRLLATHLTSVGVGPHSSEKMEIVLKKENEFEDEEMVVNTEPESVGKAPSTVSKSRPRPMKLSEMAKPLTPQMNQTMAVAALQRVLKAERTAMLGGVATVRQKIISSLATIFSEDLMDSVVDHVMNDPRSRIEFMFSWLYEEYSWIMGFCRRSSEAQSSEDSRKMATENYSKVFCSLVDQLKHQAAIDQLPIKDRDALLVRLYLEAPMIPEEGVVRLRSFCEDPKCVAMTIDIVRQLVHRPSKQLVYLNVLLDVSSHEDEEIRTKAINCLLDELYHKGLGRIIEEYAVMYLKFLFLPEPPALLCSPEKGRKDIVTTWTEDIIKACLYLFLAVLCFNEKLVHELASVYVQANADVKRTILRLIDIPIRTMGMQSPELLKLVETCPKGAETLVTKIIHILTDKTPPSAELVERVRDMYNRRVSDVRCLIPVLSGLTKKEVLSVLPKLIKQNPDVVKQVFNRLLGLQAGESQLPSTSSPLTPAEFLIALHNIDPAKCDMKTIMKATSMCFVERTVYTQEVLAVVIQQLMDQNPLPTLLMRTVLQSLSLYPRLSGFVMNILQRLIVKQVWKQKKVWEGFIKCCQRTKPQSFAVLLQLPPQYLQELLNTSPDLKEPLLAHVMSFTDNQRIHIPKLTMDVLNGIAQFQAEAEDQTAVDDTNDRELASPEPIDSSMPDNEPPAPGE